MSAELEKRVTSLEEAVRMLAMSHVETNLRFAALLDALHRQRKIDKAQLGRDYKQVYETLREDAERQLAEEVARATVSS